MIPTDCYALRALTILPNIRISWCLRPTFMLILGRVSRSFYHQCASTRGFRPFDPGIKDIMHYNYSVYRCDPLPPISRIINIAISSGIRIGARIRITPATNEMITTIIFTPSLVARINTGSIISVTPKFLSFSAHFP